MAVILGATIPREDLFRKNLRISLLNIVVWRGRVKMSKGMSSMVLRWEMSSMAHRGRGLFATLLGGLQRCLSVSAPRSLLFFKYLQSGIGLATYILLWPEDRIMRKEDIRKVYDGSIFYEIAERRENQSPQKQRARKSGIMEIMSQRIPRSVNELGDQVKGAGGEVQKLLDEQVNNHQGSFVWNMIRNVGAMIGNITFGTGKREQNFGDHSVKVRGNA